MASGIITPLSLAYLIEISFVVNLAYHELNTYKFRDSIFHSTQKLLEPYSNMALSNNALVQPEWNQLQFLYTGDNSVAWEGKWYRCLYRFFLFSGLDRKIIRRLMALDIVILLACTLFANVNIGSIFTSPFPAQEHIALILWWGAFIALSTSILIPVLFIQLTRSCEKYVNGCVEEDETNGKKKLGRLAELGQAVLLKAAAISKVNIPK